MSILKVFGKDKLRDIEVYIGDSNEQVLSGLRGAIRDCGMPRVRTFARIADLIRAFNDALPDLLIAGIDMDPALLDVVHNIRHFKIGRNPFLVISLMVSADKVGAANSALLAGVDDVMVKPVVPGKMLDRLARLTMNRRPFIVTNDYLGPERWKQDDVHKSKIKQINVVNTLKAKATGRPLSVAEVGRAVDANMKEVMSARLDSHGLKLGWVCGKILKAYHEKHVDGELGANLLTLVGVLEGAARAAGALGDPDLSRICTTMAREVGEVAECYQNPTSLQISVIHKLTVAFELAKAAKQNSPS